MIGGITYSEDGYLKIEDLTCGEIDDGIHLNRVKNIVLPRLYKKCDNME